MERKGAYMKREELEELLGKRVKVTLLSGESDIGILHKTGEQQFKDNPNYYIPRNYYFLTEPKSAYLFRLSHIRCISVIGGIHEK